MHHENHNIKEAILLIRMAEDDTSVIPEFSYLSEELGAIGFKYDKTQTPVSLRFEIEGSKSISHRVEDGAQQIVFKNEEANIYCILSDNFLSFHSLKEYKGWDVLKKKAILPCVQIFGRKFQNKHMNGVQMTYINEFSFDRHKETVSDYLRHNFPATEFEGSVDWVQNHQVVLKMDTNTELNLFSQLVVTKDIKETNLIRLVPSATITNIYQPLSNDDSLSMLDKVHQLANDLFVKSVTTKYLEIIE